MCNIVGWLISLKRKKYSLIINLVVGLSIPLIMLSLVLLIKFKGQIIIIDERDFLVVYF